jgi:hypothetical protein
MFGQMGMIESDKAESTSKGCAGLCGPPMDRGGPPSIVVKYRPCQWLLCTIPPLLSYHHNALSQENRSLGSQHRSPR